MGKTGQTVPEMTDEWIETISKRYIQLYEKLIGASFIPEELSELEMIEKTNEVLSKLI
jgi:phosphoribosylaminoimidazole-succinocarboxamide synthase